MMKHKQEAVSYVSSAEALVDGELCVDCQSFWTQTAVKYGSKYPQLQRGYERQSVSQSVNNLRQELSLMLSVLISSVLLRPWNLGNQLHFPPINTHNVQIWRQDSVLVASTCSHSNPGFRVFHDQLALMNTCQVETRALWSSWDSATKCWREIYCLFFYKF